MLVVVRDELTKNCVEMTTMKHEQSVKTCRRTVPTNCSANAFK